MLEYRRIAFLRKQLFCCGNELAFAFWLKSPIKRRLSTGQFQDGLRSWARLGFRITWLGSY